MAGVMGCTCQTCCSRAVCVQLQRKADNCRHSGLAKHHQYLLGKLGYPSRLLHVCTGDTSGCNPHVFLLHGP